MVCVGCFFIIIFFFWKHGLFHGDWYELIPNVAVLVQGNPLNVHFQQKPNFLAHFPFSAQRH